MPRPDEVVDTGDPVTADFTYIRWLGDRKGIEERTKVWHKTIIDRTAELTEWVRTIRGLQARGIRIYPAANNHYALCRYRHKASSAASRIMPTWSLAAA